MDLLSGINLFSGLGTTAKKKPVKKAKSRGDTPPFDPNNPPPGTPEWLKSLATTNPDKLKELVGGAIGDLYKLSVMAGLADAANLHDVGITEANIMRGTTPGKSDAGGVPLTAAQEAEFNRAMRFADALYTVGMKIRNVKSIDKSLLSEADKAMSSGVADLAKRTYLGSGDEGPMSRYFRARELAEKFQSLRDNAAAQISKGVSQLTEMGLTAAQKNLTVNPSALASSAVSSASAVVDGIWNVLPTIPAIPPPPETQVARGKVWITGKEAGNIKDLDESGAASVAYALFYTILNTPPPPDGNPQNIKDLTTYGGTIVANSVAPILSSRFITKKALNAISGFSGRIKISGDFSVDLNITKMERKIAKAAFLTARKAVTAKSPYAISKASSAYANLDRLIEKASQDQTALIKRLNDAKSTNDLEEAVRDITNAFHAGLISESDQQKILAIAAKKKEQFTKANISMKPTASNVNEIVQQARDSAERNALVSELRSTSSKLDSDILDYTTRANNYTRYGGSPPRTDVINQEIQRINELIQGLKSYPEISNDIQAAKHSVSMASDTIRSLGNKVSTTTDIFTNDPGIASGPNDSSPNYPTMQPTVPNPFQPTQPTIVYNPMAGLKGMPMNINTILKYGGLAILALGAVKRNKGMIGAGIAAAGFGWYRDRQDTGYSAIPQQKPQGPQANPVQQTLLQIQAQRKATNKINPILLYTMLKNAQN